MSTPTDIANQALDAAGIDFTLGDIEEGTRPAQVILRAYGQCLRQLLRSAHWDFARKTAPLVLLGDATGQTPGAGTQVAIPWTYEYEYPADCMKARFIPWNYATPGTVIPPNNIQIPTQPLTTGMGQPSYAGRRIHPARFTIATDANYPPSAGQELGLAQGVSPPTRTVVLTNVKEAQMVYTALILYPAVWDALFRAGFVAYLASEIILPLSKDKAFALRLRAELISTVKQKVTQARLVDGNEGWYSSDIRVDWMGFRNVGGGRGWSGPNIYGSDGAPGCYGYGWDSCAFSDGSAY